MTPLSPEVEKAIRAALHAIDNVMIGDPREEEILRGILERFEASARRDERRKALLEACAAVCERCAQGMPTWSQAVPGSEYIHTWGEGSEVLWPCTAMGVRALLVVEGEPEPKKEGT